MKVTVFGATGELGRRIVELLVAGGHDVVAVVRREEQLQEVAGLGASGVVADLAAAEQADLVPALVGVDAVVWSAGARWAEPREASDLVNRDAAIRAIAAAVEVGVPRWVQISSMYANRWESGLEIMQRTLRNKGVADEALKASGMAWTVLRPAGMRNEPGTGVVRAAPELEPSAIERADVAAFVVELLRTGRGVGVEVDMINAGGLPIAEAVAAL